MTQPADTSREVAATWTSLKILFLIHNPNNPFIGAARVYHVLAATLRQRGHDVTMRHVEDFGLPAGRRANFLAAKFLLPHFVSRSAGRADLSGYDIIMSSSGMAAPLFRRLRRQGARAVLVNHLHGLCLHDHVANLSEAQLGHWRVTLPYRLVTGPFQVGWDKAGVASGDVTVVQNLRDLSSVRAMPDSPPTVTMIPPALHPDLLAASAAAAPIERRDPGRLLWFATWESRKGSYYVPAAFRRVREIHPNATLTLGGTGMTPEKLKAQFDPRDREAITVLGFVSIEEHVALLNDSAIFLFPSLSEGFGLALVEGLAFGLGGVTANTGFAADFLRDGVSARVVFPSSEHIAQAILDLMGDPGLRYRLACAGREVARGFTPDRMADAYERLFLDQVASPSAPRPLARRSGPAVVAPVSSQRARVAEPVARSGPSAA